MKTLAAKNAIMFTRPLSRSAFIALIAWPLLVASISDAQEAPAVAVETQPATTPTATPSVDDLIRNLSSPDVATRVNATRALGERGEVAAVPQLTTLLQSDPVPEVRGWIVRSLRQIGTQDAVRAVVAAAQGDPDERVRSMAAELAGLSSQSVQSQPAAPPDFQGQSAWQRAAPPQVQVRPHRQRVPGRGLRTGGIAALSASYGLALIVGLALLTAGDDTDPYGDSTTNRVEWGWKLLLPIVGPAVASTTSAYNNPDARGAASVMCWIWTAAQIAGLTLLSTGFALRARHQREQAAEEEERRYEEAHGEGSEETDEYEEHEEHEEHEEVDEAYSLRRVGVAFVPAGPGFTLIGYF